MSKKDRIKELISRWPSREALASDVNASVAVVHKWARHGRIPSNRQRAVVEAAQGRGFSEITADWMIDQHVSDLSAAE